ncbi:MAG: response regulator [Kofleriaceae bacterium]|nr:response regulator [Kofleriaceae bacterium]
MSQLVDRSTRLPLIWIADDSAIEGRLTQRALGGMYEYEHFLDGAPVIERLAAGGRQPDVLLLDWMMQTMNGDEVCRFLRSHPATAELPIILLTASRVETSDVVQGLAVGANDYVARPFVAEELRARVDTLIRAKRLRELAARERTRLAAVGRLGRAMFDAGPQVERVVAELARSLVEGLCDGCAITVVPGATNGITTACHRSHRDELLLRPLAAVTDPGVQNFASPAEARAKLPASYHPAIERFGMSSLAVVPFPTRAPLSGVVTVTRDGHSEPFDREDIATIETCLEYAAMAFENALRFDAERTARTQLQTILEQLPIALLVAETDGTLTHVNQSMMNLIPGSRHAHSVAEVRDHFRAWTHEGAEIPAEQRPISRALRGETVRGVEYSIDSGTGSRNFVRAAAVPLRDARGATTAAVLAIDDVTAEHLAATEREQAAQFQNYVLGIVSHDLRTPLQTLLMGCEGLRMVAGDNKKAMQFTERMQSTTKRMQGIIEQLLDVTRARAGGGIPMTRSAVELSTVVSRVIDEVSLAYPNVVLDTRLGRVSGAWDADRLAQVVANLVGNAIQHGKKESPVTIETQQLGEHAELRVTNHTKGAPLTREQIANIFSPFRRASGARSGGTGLGLGLFIAHEILRSHGGDISVESNAGVTTFLVRLPLIPPQAGDEPTSPSVH